nr:MAG TPA: hypothetical protein [Caudoviricetes sp.]
MVLVTLGQTIIAIMPILTPQVTPATLLRNNISELFRL